MPDHKPGRPPLDAKIDVRISGQQFDAGYAKARAERLSMAAWVRRVVQAAIDGRPPMSDKS
jgi:predicted HicB family RNase H-like nuclease